MGLVVVPIKKDKLEDWKSWTVKLKGEKETEFKEMNKRFNLTRHSVWLAETSDGPVAVVLHEGSGGHEFMPKLASSDNKFDTWFKESVEEFHGMKLDEPPKGAVPEQML